MSFTVKYIYEMESKILTIYAIHLYLRRTVSVAEAVGGVRSPFMGMHVYFPESPGIKLDMSRVPSTSTFTRDFRDLTKHTIQKKKIRMKHGT